MESLSQDSISYYSDDSGELIPPSGSDERPPIAHCHTFVPQIQNQEDIERKRKEIGRNSLVPQRNLINERFGEMGVSISDDLIGSGSFGGVYHGKMREKDVAIKIVANGPQFSLTKGEGVGLLLEKKKGFHRTDALLVMDQTTGKFHCIDRNHPLLHELSGKKGVVIIATVSKYRPGKSLAHRIKERSLTPTAIARLCWRLIGTVRSAHQLGLVHNDIAARNLFLSPEKTGVEGDEKGKLADWGEASEFKKDAQRDWEGVIGLFVELLNAQMLALDDFRDLLTAADDE